MKHKKIIGLQVVVLVVVLSLVYFMYPKTDIGIHGNTINFDSKADMIIISENEDFSNPRYINLSETDSFRLEPGTYYWKADNGLIKGWENKFTIDSEVGMRMDRSENESKIKNIGNVKVNISKEDGIMVGHIILEPEEEKAVEDKGNYTGRQDD